MNDIKKYIKHHLLQVEFEGDDVLILFEKDRYKIVDKKDILFDEDLTFLPELKEEDYAGFVYFFGGRWYLHKVGEEVSFTPFLYVGKAKQTIPTKSFLGIRSGQELLNGTGLYKNWIKKAKFLGTEALGICEKKTLSGVLLFQEECEKNGIKSIIGMTVPLLVEDTVSDIKVYAKNFQGWLSLLKINDKINVENEIAISVEFLKSLRKNLFVIADPKSLSFSNSLQFDFDYYQIDIPYYLDSERDRSFLENLKKYLKSDLEPISISDAFYLEEEDYKVREILWKIGKVFDDRTNNQYFKNRDKIAQEFFALFKKVNQKVIDKLKRAFSNEQHVVDNCNFKYDTDTRHLPKYILKEDEKKKFGTRENLFLHLIKEGFEKRQIKNTKDYIERLKVEINVLKKGDVIDYFLSLYDIVSAAHKKGFLTGIGRGSAGGSLVAYLLGLTQMDPLKFNLLFERFLNLGRMGEWVDRPFYIIETDEGKVELPEGALLKIKRNGEKMIINVKDLQENDDIQKY